MKNKPISLSRKTFAVIFIGKYDFKEKKGGIEYFSSQLFKKFKDKMFFIFLSKKKIEGKSYLNLMVPFEFLEAPFAVLPFKPLLKVKIIHINLPNPFLEAQLLLYWICKSKKQKLIVTYHADIPYYTMFHKILDLVRFAWLFPLLALSDLIITTSYAYAKTSFVLRRFERKILIIPLGVELPKYASFKRKGKLKKLLFIGRLCKYKGLEYLIRACKLIEKEDFLLQIAGTGPLFKELTKLVRRLGLEKRVKFLGEVSEKMKRKILKESDIFILPSINRGEAFGLAALEAMAYGIPIISTNIRGSGITILNLHGKTGYVVEPKDYKKLAFYLKKLLRNESLRKRLGRNARKRAFLFSSDKMIESYRRVYSQFLKS